MSNILWPELLCHLDRLLSARETPGHLSADVLTKVKHKVINEGFNFVNIGGGKRFDHPDWINIDSSPNSLFPRFYLNQGICLPISNDSVQLVYSSHTLEHLSDDIVNWVVSESWRILKPGGTLLIQIPDFDMGLDFWRSGSTEMVDALLVRDVTDTWECRGVRESVDNLCSTLFCAFWNSAYGDHYAGLRRKDPPGFHGPPRVTPYEYQAIKSLSPHEISKILVAKVITQEVEGDFHFNHRNSWSRQQFDELLTNLGFVYGRKSKEIILAHYKWIPEIARRSKWSSFYLYQKVN